MRRAIAFSPIWYSLPPISCRMDVLPLRGHLGNERMCKSIKFFPNNHRFHQKICAFGGKLVKVEFRKVYAHAFYGILVNTIRYRGKHPPYPSPMSRHPPSARTPDKVFPCEIVRKILQKSRQKGAVRVREDECLMLNRRAGGRSPFGEIYPFSTQHPCGGSMTPGLHGKFVVTNSKECSYK